MKLTLPAFTTLVLILTTPVQANELAIPGHLENVTAQEMPSRGWSKSKVLDSFGEPNRRIPPVGEPAISEWDFGTFRVYFENDIVLHSLDLNSLVMPTE